MRVLICGGGVIGAAIAYHLSLREVEAVVIESTGLASAASGKSGGFLARDWCDGSALAPLARRSFDLHGELAQAGVGEWGYRRLDTLGVVASARRSVAAYGRHAAPDWLGDEAAVHGALGTPETTAQVHPARFTEAMMAAAINRGARLETGRVEGLSLSTDGRTAAGDAVVIAMGPWSVLAGQWLALPAVYGLKGHSLVFRNPGPIGAEALFVEYEAEDGEVQSPEVYPRPDGTTYVCGLPGQSALPVDPAAVGPDAGAYEQLRAMVGGIAPSLASAEVLASQTCYRPVTQDGLPLIGRAPGVANAYVATGHSVWGILNAPATGEAMAELIVDGAAHSVDIRPFDPARLAPLETRDIQIADPWSTRPPHGTPD
ncbi:MAG: FAD-dependent oxidoreductase [Alphaproteobacteria bacterium]|jgi:glycine/D-amino acid oxidase-like deaminating enzyme|nr:FAD-dependent oxidoreductase [Alphaproteobacteria bacterium]